MRASVVLLASFVEELCIRNGASVTSWWRTRMHNAKLPGSVPDSRHMWGEAVDLVYDGQPPDLEELNRRAAYYMCRVVREKDHDHVQSVLSHSMAGGGEPPPPTGAPPA